MFELPPARFYGDWFITETSQVLGQLLDGTLG